MISYLSVKNIALIQELTVEFKKGLNVLSGETGAGKSIIIDSINFVLGDRADRSLIRHGEKAAKVEVVFTDVKNYDEIQKILSDADIDGEDGTVIVSRTMSQDRSECRINRKIVNLSLLRTIVALLVDTHSQNEHQTLLKASSQAKILDQFNAKIGDYILNYRKDLDNYYKIIDNLSHFPNENEREREIDMLQFQISEIEKTDWKDGEEEELNTKRLLFYNSQKIISALQSAYNALSGDNGFGGTSSIRNALSDLKSISQYDETLSDLIDRLESVSIELNDISETVGDKASDIDVTDINVDSIEARLEQIRLLKKKYGRTYQDVKTFYENALSKLNFYANSQATIDALLKEKEEKEKILIVHAKKLHAMRVETAKIFCKTISDNLKKLGMKNAVFEIKFGFDEEHIIENLNQNGADSLEFMLSPNLGEPVKPLAKIASGGEMSRFMLAIKNVIAQIDDVDTLIFDEVDTGISGAIARVVAEKLYNISTQRQVIAITHLPQLASMGDVNFLIEKKVVGDKTQTFLQELDENAVLKELMRLSGSTETSKFGLSSAQELKESANAYKKSLVH